MTAIGPQRHTADSSTRRRISSVWSTCGTTSRTRRRHCPATGSARCAKPNTCTTCGSGSGRTCTRNSRRPAARWVWPSTRPRWSRPRPHRDRALALSTRRKQTPQLVLRRKNQCSVGGRVGAAVRVRPRRAAGVHSPSPWTTRRSTPPWPPACCRTSAPALSASRDPAGAPRAIAAGRCANTRALVAPPSPSGRGPCSPRAARPSCLPRNSSRPPGCGRAPPRRSTPHGSSQSAETCCAATTPSPGGARSGRPCWPPRR